MAKQTKNIDEYLKGLEAKTAASGAENVLINDGGTNKAVSLAKVKEYANAGQPTTAQVANKVDKVSGKGLSTNDYTNEEKQKLADALTKIDSLNSAIEGSADYYVAEHDEQTGSPKFLNGKGNKSILEDWHPFLIDHTDNTEECTRPVGQLMDNNFFRFTSGAFAPAVGITEEMRAACDVQLYTDEAHTQPLTLKNGVVVTAKDGAHPYDATEVYNSLGLVTLYDAEGNKVRQLLPWETTETKYSIMIGRYDTLYLVDRQVGKSGKMLSGIFLNPITYDGIQTGRFPLLGSALSPCPITTIGGKARTFFYAYQGGDSNTANAAGLNGLCTMFKDLKRTFPRTADVTQISNMKWARANNADATSPVPFAEGGYHAINTFITCMELFYGTKYLHDNNLFGSGISSNNSCNSESTFLANGGVRCKEQGTDTWRYGVFYSASPFGGGNYYSFTINYNYAKEQCMESQMAASWAAEFGIAEGEEFEAYGAKYHYKNIVGAKGLADGKMNCKVLKVVKGTAKGDTDGVTYDVEVSLRMSLTHGMNLSGDIFAYWGGGCEMVGTNKVKGTGSFQQETLDKDYVDFYLEPNQSKWAYETSSAKDNLGTFPFESVYSKIGTFGPPILSDGYAKTRLGFTPYKTAVGGGLNSWQCLYTWSFPYWSDKIDQRARIGLRLRGSSNASACSARYLNANNSAAISNVHYGGSALCRIRRS